MENLEKLRKLGKGSFGNVHLVKDKRTNELFALKKVLFDNQNPKLNPINEVKLMNSLENCNVIKCFGYFSKKEKLYILMEFADDGDLDRVVKDARKNSQSIPEKNVLTWFTQICLALKYLHDKNILHRDIKLQNIFMMKNGLIKLGDFGISKKLENSTDLAQTSLGTPYYLSPELCSAMPYGRKTDIWMLGCLLYELCALERPFSGDNISVLMNKILKEEPKAASSTYSGFIHKLISNLLAKNQQKRPEIEEILQIKEIRLEIKSLSLKYPENYKNLEEIYCKDLNDNFLQPHKPEAKKKSLIKPLSYSTLPGLETMQSENVEKFSTPHNQKVLDKNSILNVIKQAKKQTLFKPHEDSTPMKEFSDTPQVLINVPSINSADIEFNNDSHRQSNRVSFEQYLSHKLVVEKNDDNSSILVKKVPSKKEIERLTDDPRKSPSNKLGIQTKKLGNLEIIDEKTSLGKGNNLEEEEKRNFSNNNSKILISPTNFNKLKRNSPKGIDNLITSNEVSTQRYRLFVEFLKERLGEEKFQKVKGVLQSEDTINCSSTVTIEKKRNEVLEIIGIKNIELLKYLGVLCNEGGEKRKTTVEGGDMSKDEGRIERTSSGYGKLECFHRK